MSMQVERSFPADATSVRGARTFVADALADTAVDGDVVQLLTSELATNAVLHAGSGFRVRVRSDPRVVRVEVVNSEPELLLAMREPSVRGGRGLKLVTALSLDWGAESSRDEKVVWFEIPASSAAELRDQ
jgi:anti-sigma regulatory factor (Ser/Thr protein kinase)